MPHASKTFTPNCIFSIYREALRQPTRQRSRALTTSSKKQILNDVCLHLPTWNWVPPTSLSVRFSVNATARKSATAHWRFVDLGWTVFTPKPKLKDKQEHFHKEPPKRKSLSLVSWTKMLNVPRLSASDPSIPARRPSETSRRAEKYINNTTKRGVRVEDSRDGDIQRSDESSFAPSWSGTF